MSDRQQQRAIGVFSDAQTTQEALQELQSAGFPMENVSVIGKDADPDKQVGGAEVSDRIGETKVESATSAVANAASSGAFGTVMLGLTSLAIPGVGPVVAAGSLATALVATLGGQGASALAAHQIEQALGDLGIPEAQVNVYGEHLHQGDYLVFVEGTADQLSQAEGVFGEQIQDWSVYAS
ncbi:MAG: hypothetical protein F6K32_17375 [Desertifilum sp. SIO1I2]|nr:hypothetical protein [Desertifilum sp. SIO1I2]